MASKTEAQIRGTQSRLTGILSLFVLSACNTSAQAQSARDYISIVGSSTVYPFSTVVAERFGRATDFKTPTIESTGTGGGFKLFCGGIGVQHPDIANASRRIKASEIADCGANGVARIIEVKIGYDGIVIANARRAPGMSLTREQVFLALAKNVPDPASGERLVPNPYRRWSDIDASLPDRRIEVYGPPPTSGTRDAFLELVMDPGCGAFPAIAALTGNDRTAACHTIREDNLYIDSGENDNLIVQKIEANPAAVGIFGFSFLDQNTDKVQGALVDGVAPTFDAIADGDYPVSRPLYFYVKAEHAAVIPGIREFLAEFTSDSAFGEYGYLSDTGLIPMPDDERREVVRQVRALEPLDPAAITD
jgi:phosphate transport system substrate-binding protein